MPQKIFLDNAGYKDFEVKLDFDPQYMGGSAVSFKNDFTINFAGECQLTSKSKMLIPPPSKGTSLSLFGAFWTINAPSSFQVIVDGGQPTDIQYRRQGFLVNSTYTSPILEDTEHTIQVLGLAAGYLDYATVKMGNRAPLLGQTVVVDEDDTSITYRGDWSENSNKIGSGSYSARMPYGGSTSETQQPGSSATFVFSGTSVSVFGAPPDDAINIQFTLDGTPSNRSFVKNIGAALHYTFFSVDSLSTGDHVLEMEYIGGPGAMRLDYIINTTYQKDSLLEQYSGRLLALLQS
ncbi:hypothetical protein C0991_009206 [Blastosporella zonata]|nr:hypothetical protein C0991_009206 [Blastosporella zonata]